MRTDAASALIGALAALWRRIQALHPEVPDVVLLPAPGPRNVLGHFAPFRWQQKTAGGAELHEVVVVAEHLTRSAADIAETVLHEAAHALNCARGVKDCSATSQYHNEHFRKTAEEIGLSVTKVPNYGFAYTELRPETLEAYRPEIEALAAVLVHRRSPGVALPPPPGDAGGDTPSSDPTTAKPKSRLLKATCRCGFIIRASRLVLDTVDITCSRCETEFRADA